MTLFSSRVLNFVSCPLFIIGGSCVWDSYTKTIPDSSRLISFLISEDVNGQYALEYNAAGTALRRIAAKVGYPSFGFRNPTSAASAAIRFDTQCNFILWLGGRNFVTQSYETTLQKHRRGKPGSAPFSEFWCYRNQERQLGIVLKHDDFDADFLCWASRFLKTSAESILRTGQSIVKLIENELSRRKSNTRRNTRVPDASRKALLEGLERTIHRRKDLGRVVFDVNVRGMKIPIPYLTGDAEAMRRQEQLDILLKVDFAENQPSFTLCAPNTQSCDSAYDMRIMCTYVLKEGKEMYWKELWVT